MLVIPVPPTEFEQRAIATALSDVDGLLGGLDRLIAKKRDLKQAAMQQLLTGQTRLPGFHGEWEVKRLGDFGKCLRGVSYKGDSDLSTHDTPHTKRLLRSNNVQNAVVVTDEVQFVNAARVSSHQILQRDDILICMANGSKALVGKAGIFMVSDGHEYTFGAFMGCFRTNSAEASPGFAFYLFLTARYRDYINNLLAGSSINNLRPSSIESLEFSTPPLPEQTAIAKVLRSMDEELAGLEQRREKTRALKQAMMQELLSGKTRMPVTSMKPTPPERGSLTAIGKDGRSMTYQFSCERDKHLEGNGYNSKTKWCFLIVEGQDVFQFDLVEEDGFLRVEMMNRNGCIRYKGRGITEAFIRLSHQIFQLPICSSIRSLPQPSSSVVAIVEEQHSDYARNVWQGLVANKEAYYDKDKQRFTYPIS